MAHNISDKDIVQALNGRASAQEQAANDAIARAFGRTPQRVVTEDELPLKKRGDDLEGVAIWAAKEAASRSISSLTQALMRADASKGIYAAEAEANEIAAEAYAQASKLTPYEDRRQEHVQKFVTKMATLVTPERPKAPKSAPAQPSGRKAAGATEAIPRGRTKTVSTSRMTGAPITYYS